MLGKAFLIDSGDLFLGTALVQNVHYLTVFIPNYVLGDWINCGARLIYE
jgi:hypothetical protein